MIVVCILLKGLLISKYGMYIILKTMAILLMALRVMGLVSSVRHEQLYSITANYGSQC
ncbi:MAG: hypothetical protein ACJAS1_002865 [Oleiphilaceae bacterium]